MKLLITATAPNLDAAVDPRFGRAPWFLVIDEETGQLLEAIDNKVGVDAAQGAGIAAASMVAEKGINKIYTGRLGPKAMAVIEQAGIEVIEGVSGPVRSILTGAEQVEQTTRKTTTSQAAGQQPMGGGRCRGGGEGRGGGMGRGRGGGKGMGQCRRG